MIVLCTASPRSLLKAALLSRVYKCPAMHVADYTGSLWQDPKSVMVEDLAWQEVYQKYQESFGPVNWLEDSRQNKKLAVTVYYAVRYNAGDRYSLALRVLDQALTGGAEYVLAKVSPEAKNLLSRARQVCMELHRAYGFIRFNPSGSDTVIGRAELTHNTADLVLSYFARRYRKHKIVLLANGLAHIWDNGKVTVVEAGVFAPDTPADDFSVFWDAYYDSQVIEGRLNKELARKHLPKKYWSWVEEGWKLK